MNTCLIILDGFGISSQPYGNAVLNAKTPTFDYFATNFPHALLKTSSESVGLGYGVWGNSETGHATIGSGRVCWQNMEEIQKMLENKEVEHLDSYISFSKSIQDKNLHIISLFSDGNVHSNYKQTIEFIKLFQKNAKKVWIHIISDGRDSDPQALKKYVNSFLNNINIDYDKVEIASIIGRFYAMDRDLNWERVKTAYDLIVNKRAKVFNPKPRIAINDAYKIVPDDEKLPPILVGENYEFQQDDPIFFANFRADRTRQLVRMFKDKISYDNSKTINSPVLTLTNYQLDHLNLKSLIPLKVLENTLSQTISSSGVHQLHIAETEKYAHVTYFFNGGQNKAFIGETDRIIPSIKTDSYDKVPQMSSGEITDQIIKEMHIQKNQFILVNFANADMLGHTGNYLATIKSIEFLDQCLAKLYKSAQENQYTFFITADHGNADLMIDMSTKLPNKEHSTSPVPFIFVNDQYKKQKNIDISEFYNCIPIGILADIAPTILEFVKITKPAQMTGQSLLKSLS